MKTHDEFKAALKRARKAAYRNFRQLSEAARGKPLCHPESQRAIGSFDAVNALNNLARTFRRIERKHRP